MLDHINYRIICRMYMFSCAVPLAPGTRSESQAVQVSWGATVPWGPSNRKTMEKPWKIPSKMVHL